MASGQIPRKQVNITLSEGTSYGTTNVPALSNSDTMESAFSKLTSILDKLAPQTPPLLNQLSMTRSLSGITLEKEGDTAYLSTTGASVDNVFKFVNSASVTWTTNGDPLGISGNRNGYFGDVSDPDAKIKFTHSNGATTEAELELASIGELTDAASITNGSGTFSFTTESTLAAGDGLRITLDDDSTLTRTVNTFTQGSPNTVVASSDVIGTISKIQVITAERTGSSYSRFNLLDVKDFWSESSQESTFSNFYESMKFSVTADLETTNNDASTEARVVQLLYSPSGLYNDNISPLTSMQYYVEMPDLPSPSILSITPPVMNGVVSGVPTLEVGDEIDMSLRVEDGIKFFYPGNIGISSVSGTNDITENIDGTAPGSGATHDWTVSHSVLGNRYEPTVSATLTGADVFTEVQTTPQTVSGVRIDTKSLALASTDATSRILYPTTDASKFTAGNQWSVGYYDVAQHSNSLNNTSSSIYGNALQLLNGKYQYPANTDYTSYGGPSYLSGANFGVTRPTRWATFKFTETVNLPNDAQYLRMEFTNTTSFTKALRQAGTLQVYYKLKYTSGGAKETLWLDTKYAINPGAFSSGTPYMTGSGNTSPYGGTLGTGTLDSTKANDNDIYATVGESIPDGTVVDVIVMVGIAYNAGTNFVLPEANITLV